MKKILVILLAVSITIFTQSCSKKVKYTKENTLHKGIIDYQKGKYEKAIKELKHAIYDVKGMTNQEIMVAKFTLANAYFKKGMYIDAIVEFEEFISLYPTSKKIPEALVKLAKAYYKISPSPDRDLTYVYKAEEKAMEVINNYPTSRYVVEAERILRAAKKKEALHYIKIAELYEKLGKYYSASVYYNDVYDNFTDYIQKDYIEYKLGYCLLNVDKQYKKTIKNYKEKIKKIEKKIKKAKTSEEKEVLTNRKMLLEEQLNTFLERIETGKKRGIVILENAYKMYPKSPYRKSIKALLKHYKKEVNKD